MDIQLERFAACWLMWFEGQYDQTDQGRQDHAEWRASGKPPEQFMQDKYNACKSRQNGSQGQYQLVTEPVYRRVG